MNLRLANNDQGGPPRTPRVKLYLFSLRLCLTKGNHIILIHKTWNWLAATIVSNIHGVKLVGLGPNLLHQSRKSRNKFLLHVLRTNRQSFITSCFFALMHNTKTCICISSVTFSLCHGKKVTELCYQLMEGGVVGSQ
jgi:hypothetical protein